MIKNKRGDEDRKSEKKNQANQRGIILSTNQMTQNIKNRGLTYH
jgi:hypothetical protein